MNEPAHSFGQFELVHKIADGGMGEILLASDTRLNRPVAIKRVLEKFRSRPDVSRMFEAEATVMSVLRHANIVRVFESGEVDGIFYFSMEYIHGKTLRQLVDRARETGESIPPGLVIQIISQLGDALGYAHAMKGPNERAIGIVHRDVNPANLLIGYDGSVKLIDFGIVQTDEELAPDDFRPKGKAAYMSPEQTQGGRVDRRSDLFSLGICLYEALTLYNPFIHDLQGIPPLEAIQEHDPPPLAQRNQRLAPLDPLIAKMLEKSPDRRLGDAQQFIDELLKASEAAKLHPLIPLESYMSDLFEDQKRQEDALLESAKLGRTSSISVRGNYAPPTPKPPPLAPKQSSAGAPPRPANPRSSGSNLLFVVLVASIGLATLVGSLFLYRTVLQQRIDAAAITPTAPVDAGSLDEGEIGTVKVETQPSVRVAHGGERIARDARIELGATSGSIAIGLGRSRAFDPFAVVIDYERVDGVYHAVLRSEPTATVKSATKNVEQTPLEFQAKNGAMTFQLSKTDERRSLEILLEFNLDIDD